jgi:hypothetical protein
MAARAATSWHGIPSEVEMLVSTQWLSIRLDGLYARRSRLARAAGG